MIKTFRIFVCVLSITALVDRAQAAQLYGITGDGGTPATTLYLISTFDATSTIVAALGDQVLRPDGEAIAYHPGDGLLYRASGDDPYLWESIDPSTGSVIFSGAHTTPAGEVAAMTYDPGTGTFLVLDRAEEYSTTTTAGINTGLGIAAASDISQKGLALVGSKLLSVGMDDGFLSELNLADGSTIAATSVTLAGEIIFGFNGLATDPDTGMLYALARIQSFPSNKNRALITIDPATAVATLIGDTGANGGPLGFASITFVPEPSTISMGIVCLLSLATLRRRHDRK